MLPKRFRTFLKLALFKALLLTPVAAHAILGSAAGEYILNQDDLQDADFHVTSGTVEGPFYVNTATAVFRSTMTLSGARPVSITAPLSGQVLKYNGSSWAPGTDNAGAGTTLAVKQDNSIFDAATSTIDFASADFSLTDSPAGEVNFTLVATNPKFIQNRDTLQAGATSYVFNSTVDGFLTVISSYTTGQQFPVRFQGRAPPATNLSFPLGFYFLNSTNALEEFAAIDAVTREVTTNTVNGKLRFKIASDSVEKTMLEMSSEATEDYVAFPTTNRVYFGTNASTGAFVKSSGSNLILSPGQNDAGVTLQPDSSGISYWNGATGGRVVINKGTSTTAHDGLVVISSQATQASIDSLAHLISLTTSYNEIMLWIQSNSASTLGANADIRIDANNPDIELQETDTLSAGTGNGKWEIAVNFDQFQINQRNATDTSFQTLLAVARDGSFRFKELDNGGDFVGFIATNTLSTSYVYKLPSDNPADGASLHTRAYSGGFYDMYWTKDIANTSTLQSGATFFVSVGRITSPLGAGATSFIVTQNDTSAQAIRVISTGTANAVYIEDDGDAGSGSGSSGALFINNTFNPGIAFQIYSNNASPTSNNGMVFFKYANSGATKPLMRLDNLGTGNSIKIVEGGNKGTTLGSSGAILIDNSQNAGIGVQIYSSSVAATGALLHVMADSTTWAAPLAVFESTSANSTAVNVRLKDQDPDLEFQEIDQATPAGKYKIDVQSDQMRFLARNSADNAYELFAKFNPVRTGMFLELESTGTLRLNDADNSRYVQLKASDTVVNNLTFVLPAADGSSGQALVTDGAGNLSFATISGGGGSGDNLGSHVATMTITAGFGINATTITVPTIEGNTAFTGSVSIDNSGSNPLTVTGSGSTFGGAHPIMMTINNENGAPFNSWWIEFQSAGTTNGYFGSGNNQQNNFYSADFSKMGGFYFGGTGTQLNIGDAGMRSDGSGNLEVKTPGGTQKSLTASDLLIGNVLSATSLATNSSGQIIAGGSGILTATQTWSGSNTFVGKSTFTNTVTLTNLSPGVLHTVATSSAVTTALVSLSTEVTGTLPIANGGTNLTTFTQGDILYSDASNSLAKLAKDTNSTRYLSNTGTSNNPAWAQVNLANGVSGTLPAGNLPATVAYTDSANTFTKSQTVSDGGVSASTIAVGGLYINPNIKTANYTITSTDTIINASGTITITFPSLTNGTSQQVIVTKVNKSTQPVTINVGSQVMFTTTTFLLNAPGQSMWLYSDGSNWSPLRTPNTPMYIGFPDDPNSAAIVTASTTYCRAANVPDYLGITDVRVNVGAQALQSSVAVYQDGVKISSSNFTTIGTGKVTIPLNTVAYLHPGVAWVCFGSQSATTSVTRASASTSALGVCSFATSLPFPDTRTFAGCTASNNAYAISGLVGGGGAAP